MDIFLRNASRPRITQLSKVNVEQFRGRQVAGLEGPRTWRGSRVRADSTKMDEKHQGNPAPNRKEWREHLVNKLQTRYGLTGEQARAKADAWLQQLDRDMGAPASNATTETRDRRSARSRGLNRSGKSKSGAAGIV
jgi:hypothetical protein